MSGKVMGYVMARNEWPLLGLAITHALENVVDHLVVVNHASTDDTAAGLAQLSEIWPGKITVIHLQYGAFFQEATTAVILAMTRASSYEWIYVFDSDEFLLVEANEDLRSVLAGMPDTVDVVRYEVHQWIAPHDMRDRSLEQYGSIIYRSIPCIFTKPPDEILAHDIERGYVNFFDVPFDSKVIIRGRYANALAAGAHGVSNYQSINELTLAPDQLRVGHLPMLSRDRLNLKCRQGEALMDAGFPPGHGWQSQMLRRIELAGELDRFWAVHSVDPAGQSPSSARTTTEIDTSLTDVLCSAVTNFDPMLVNPEVDAQLNDQPVLDLVPVIAMTHALKNELAQAVAERERLAAELDELRAERDRAVGERNEIAVERDQVVTQLSQAVAERDQVVGERNQARAERDQMVAVVWQLGHICKGSPPLAVRS
jgi:regulator of replication initiation timing